MSGLTQAPFTRLPSAASACRATRTARFSRLFFQSTIWLKFHAVEEAGSLRVT
jgi:hypothetical protein